MAEVQNRHVFVIPGCGEGHVNGMFRLALLLAGHKGLLVSFGYPARSHALALKLNKLAHLPPTLRVHVVDDGLPSIDHEAPTKRQLINSSSVIAHDLEVLLQRLMVASSADAFPSENRSSSSAWPRICCIISDTFLPATQVIADNLSIPRVDFWTGSATVYNIFLHVHQLLAKNVLPLSRVPGEDWKVDARLIDFIPGLPPCHLTQLPWDLLQAYDVSQPMIEFLVRAFARAKDGARIVVHSVYELEKHVYDTMRARGFPFYAIGPIFFEAKSDPGADRSECLDWLDLQKSASVVYVAFGTVNGLGLQEMQVMAFALEACNHPFLWVVPTDSLRTITDSSDSFLKGFMERTVSHKCRGLIVAWAPQLDVLNHSAVGAFISHCGWNSVLESLWGGVPMVTCPQVAEQNSNAKSVVEDWKVGVEMEREDGDGSFTKEAVQKAIEEVMGNEEVRERALQLKRVVRQAVSAEGSSHGSLVSLVEYLRHLPVPSISRSS